MKTSIRIAAWSVLALCACSGDKVHKTSLERNNMHGRVCMVTETSYMPGDSLVRTGKTVYRYNEQGRQTEGAWYDATDSLVNAARYTGDGNENIVRGEIAGADGTLLQIYDYAYDRHGNMERMLVSQADGRAESRTELRYDRQGRVREIEIFDGQGGFAARYKCLYDDRDRVTCRKSYDVDGALMLEYRYEYDDRGNPVSIRLFNPEGKSLSTISSEYRYDPSGNWTRKTDYASGRPVGQIFREIVYF